jgi:Tfp pilus assembly protein PilF
VVHHFGFPEDAGNKRARKEACYYDLAIEKARSAPGDCQANLGAGIAELDHARNSLAALPYFCESVRLDGGRADVWLYAGICLTRLGRMAQAQAHLERSVVLDAGNSPTLSSIGDLNSRRGRMLRERRRIDRRSGGCFAFEVSESGCL